MPALAESNLTSTYLQLRERTFIGIESFLGFLDQAGLEARQMEFDPERGVATAPDGR